MKLASFSHSVADSPKNPKQLRKVRVQPDNPPHRINFLHSLEYLIVLVPTTISIIFCPIHPLDFFSNQFSKRVQS